MAAMPGAFNLNLYRGDSYAWTVRLWIDDAASVPYDLTDVTAKSEIRDKPAGATIVPVDVAVELPNIVHLALDAATSHTIPALGAWDLQLTDDDGGVHTVLAGSVKVVTDVTDSTP